MIRWSRDDNLKSFPTEGPHLVFDTDRPESAGGDVLESFRSSMTLDFLRQRFALTRIQPSFPHQFLLFHPRVFVSAPFAAWTRVRGRDRRGGRVRGGREGLENGWPSFIGNTFLRVKNKAAMGFSISR